VGSLIDMVHFDRVPLDLRGLGNQALSFVRLVRFCTPFTDRNRASASAHFETNLPTHKNFLAMVRELKGDGDAERRIRDF
jgi:hypothetical protein